MREILFRGKSIDNGKWIYGGYLHLHKTTYCYAGYDDGDNDIHRIVFERMTDWNLPNRHMMADVDPKTVGQYTGMTDKNGVKIFEGDIVRVKYTCSDGDETTEIVAVQYDETNCCFYPMNWNESCEWCDYSTEIKEIEVIGNIHDNPELLE